MPRIRSFPPIEAPRARLLILGTMPGRRSLAAREYYAHPQNSFWSILGGVLEFDPDAPYQARVARVRAARIAIWDVLASCTRTTSLDSDIDAATLVVNDFRGFLGRHPGIRTICFNGAAAEALFRRHVLPALTPGALPALVRLPSTSPANARLTRARKLRAWRKVIA